MNTNDRLEQIIEKFRAREYRMTPQRMALLEILCTSTEHLSAAELYERIRAQFPTTSLATVYKTLAVLKEMGEVLEISFGSDNDSHYDGYNVMPHPHLICVRCNKIVDVETTATQTLIELEHVKAIAERAGYKMINHRFDIYGLCPACQAQEENY
ncbi:MAG: transcriptional repressor [Anaerolineae bacterium]|nr:transcriptional repressor [Anaerolineae bacterium]